MLRRPLTSIELKLDDVVEYTNARREQESSKEQMDTKSSYNTPASWIPPPKTKQDAYNRIGYMSPAY